MLLVPRDVMLRGAALRMLWDAMLSVQRWPILRRTTPWGSMLWSATLMPLLGVMLRNPMSPVP